MCLDIFFTIYFSHISVQHIQCINFAAFIIHKPETVVSRIVKSPIYVSLPTSIREIKKSQ